MAQKRNLESVIHFYHKNEINRLVLHCKKKNYLAIPWNCKHRKGVLNWDKYFDKVFDQLYLIFILFNSPLTSLRRFRNDEVFKRCCQLITQIKYQRIQTLLSLNTLKYKTVQFNFKLIKEIDNVNQFYFLIVSFWKTKYTV